MTLFALLLCAFACALIKRLVFNIFKILALVSFKHLVCRLVLSCKLAENSVKKCFGKNISVAVSGFYLAVSFIWVYAKGNV